MLLGLGFVLKIEPWDYVVNSHLIKSSKITA